MRALSVALLMLLWSAVPALADGPIATATGPRLAAPESQAAAPPLPAYAPGDPRGAPVAMGPCGPEKIKADGTLETKPHGEVEAGVGTGGYRQLAGSVCQPLKNGGAVQVGVSYGQWGRGGW